MLAACGDGPTLPTPDMLAGEWVAEKDAERTFFPQADTFHFSLVVESDSVVRGTWGATGPDGTVVRLDQEVGGVVRGNEIELSLRYSQYDHGCTGPLRECSPLYYRFVGEIVSSSVLWGQVIGPPHPWLPDADLHVFAEWTLRRP